MVIMVATGGSLVTQGCWINDDDGWVKIQNSKEEYVMNGATDHQFCRNFDDGGYKEAAFVAEKVTESPK